MDTLKSFRLYKSSDCLDIHNHEKQTKKQKITSKQFVKWLDFYNLKIFKTQTQNKIEKLQTKLDTIKNENLKKLIQNKIKKHLFILQTYTQQIFDLYFKSDTLTKYNYDLLHFDLLLKSENLTSQLLYYRLIDTKNRQLDFDTYIMDSDFVKTSVFDKTQSKLIDKITNQIILDEISKNDKLKLDFLKIYYKKLNNNQTTRKTISNYKKYLIDRYSYLFSD